MVALGLLLVLVALAGGAVGVWLAARSSTGVLLEGAGLSVTVLPLTLLVFGAGVLVVLWLGWRLLVAGSRRRRAEREELRHLRSRTRETGSDTAPRQRTGAAGSDTAARTSREAATAPSREASAATSPEASTAPAPSMPERAVQPRAGTSPPSEEGSGSHAGDRPPPRS